VTLANGSDQALGYLHPGAFVGLTHAFSLIPHEETLDFIAESDVSVWRMPAEKFKALMYEHQAIGETIMAILSTRLGMMVDAVANNCLLGAVARVARCLLKSQRDAEFKVLWAKSSTAQFNVTQAQLARMLGLSRQSVGTILRDFEQKGLITLGRQKIELLNASALRELVTGPVAVANQ
jgi:CRP-like cAMP-binding protein